MLNGFRNNEAQSGGDEPAHTSVFINAVDVAQKNPNRNLMIKASNTDIVVQLIDIYDAIPRLTSVTISGKNLSISDLKSRLGEELSKALLGWYAFQGTLSNYI